MKDAEPGSSYYDSVYRKIVAGRTGYCDWADERHKVVTRHVIGSVLDIGCGMGEMANLVSNVEYVGIDISPVALQYAIQNCTNPKAKFFCLGYDRFLSDKNRQYDTVLLLEVLEHLYDPRNVVGAAKKFASKRIIATVPRDMPGRAHVRPKWKKEELEDIFGRHAICKLFGGPDNDRWWLVVMDVS